MERRKEIDLKEGDYWRVLLWLRRRARWKKREMEAAPEGTEKLARLGTYLAIAATAEAFTWEFNLPGKPWPCPRPIRDHERAKMKKKGLRGNKLPRT